MMVPWASLVVPGLKAHFSGCNLRFSALCAAHLFPPSCAARLSPLYQLKDPVPGQEWVAIAAWKLATRSYYRSVASQFGVGKSTVGPAVMEM